MVKLSGPVYSVLVRTREIDWSGLIVTIPYSGFEIILNFSKPSVGSSSVVVRPLYTCVSMLDIMVFLLVAPLS